VIADAIATALLSRLGQALAPPARNLRPLRIGASVAGCMSDERARRLAAFADVFAVCNDGVSFVSGLHDEASRSAAMARVTATLAAEGALTAWRDELYAVAPAFGTAPWFRLERAAARYFGVRTWAAHVNGVVSDQLETRMWFARRSPGKAIDPLMLDNLVGGGIPAGATIAETVVREAWEEASLPGELAARAEPAGNVHIRRENPDGIQDEVIFVHDLWLPEDFKPANQDGEAIEHRLVTMNEAARLIALAEGPDEVTVDASVVALAFLLRQGCIDPGSPAFEALNRTCHPYAAARRA
jgi:8-oxo-dGTP pyrophosphatase MutT (NUDIX family)